jgi:hypothetical protein
MMVVGEITEYLEDALDPNSTALVALNPLPVMVTVAPPPAETLLGKRDLSTGALGFWVAVVAIGDTEGMTGDLRVCPLGPELEVSDDASALPVLLKNEAVAGAPNVLAVVVADGEVVACADPSDASANIDESSVVSPIKTPRSAASTG